MNPINKKIFLEKKDPAVALGELVDIINSLIVENNTQQRVISSLAKEQHIN